MIRQAGIHRHTGKQTYICTNRQAGKHSYIDAGKHTGKQSVSHTVNMHAYRQQTGTCTYMKVFIQASRRTDIVMQVVI